MKVLTSVPFEQLLAEGTKDEGWVLKPFLMQGSSMMLYGRQGVGKSTLALQLACALSTPRLSSWLGFPNQRSGPVLWVQLDMPRPEVVELLKRGQAGGFLTGAEELLFVQMFEIEPPDQNSVLDVTKPLDGGDEVFDLNVSRASDYAELERLVKDVHPVAVIVDTIADSYESYGDKPINSEARSVLRKLRALARKVGGALIYLHHERKKPGNVPQTTNDPDAFLGPQAFEGFATASLQLKLKAADEDDETSDRATLLLRKMRLRDVGFDKIDLKKDRHGFFHPEWTARQHLLLWPDTIPLGLRPAELTLKNIVGTVATLAELSPVTIYAAYERLKKRQKCPDWLLQLG